MFRSQCLVYIPDSVPDDEAVEVKDGLSVHASLKNKNYNTSIEEITATSLTRREEEGPKPAMTTSDTSNGAISASGLNGSRHKPKKIIIIISASDEKIANSFATAASPSNSSSTEGVVVDNYLSDESHCTTCANILIPSSESANRYDRVRGAIVTSEQEPFSRKWVLVVKKDGLTCCDFHAAEESIISSSSSSKKHYQYWRVFFLDNGWRLEFANKRDWEVFKALNKDCLGRNVAKVVPIPGVRDVSDYAETYNNSVPFHRPKDYYISTKGDEVFRAVVTRKSSGIHANYDMDSEDEKWLSKFNNKDREIESHDHDDEHVVSEEKFELIVDALEKVSYFYPDVIRSNAKSASDRCPRSLASEDVVKAVSTYWMKKRKRKRRPLLRVFENNPAKAPIIHQLLLQKRRSLTRRPSRNGGAWQRFAAEQEALRDMKRIEGAEANAKALKEVAIEKRRRAQYLTWKADRSVLRARKLFRMAEAAQYYSESVVVRV